MRKKGVRQLKEEEEEAKSTSCDSSPDFKKEVGEAKEKGDGEDDEDEGANFIRNRHEKVQRKHCRRSR